MPLLKDSSPEYDTFRILKTLSGRGILQSQKRFGEKSDKNRCQ